MLCHWDDYRIDKCCIPCKEYICQFILTYFDFQFEYSNWKSKYVRMNLLTNGFLQITISNYMSEVQVPQYTKSPDIWKLAEWRSGSVSALPCERPGFASRTRLREIIPANNCTMQGLNNWGNWGSPGVMKLWVAWEVLLWLMKFRELCSGGFHPKLVTPPYHGFLNVNTPPNSQNSKRY